jgi:hypothetical protein
MLVVTNDSICYDTIQKEIIIRESDLNVDFSIESPECLDSFFVQLTDLSTDSTGGIGTRNWRVVTDDSVYNFTGPNPMFTLIEETNLRVTLTIEPTNGCPPDSLTREVELKFINLDLIGDSLSICAGESTNLLNSFDPDLDYLWTPDLFLSPNNTAPNPEATPDSCITYYVSATDGLCEVTDSVFVEL